MEQLMETLYNNGIQEDKEQALKWAEKLKQQYEDEKKGVLNKIIRGEQAIYLGQKTDTEFNREVILKMLQGFSTAGELEDQEDVAAAFAASLSAACFALRASFSFSLLVLFFLFFLAKCLVIE